VGAHSSIGNGVPLGTLATFTEPFTVLEIPLLAVLFQTSLLESLRSPLAVVHQHSYLTLRQAANMTDPINILIIMVGLLLAFEIIQPFS
jgi:hypothetical protein